MCNRIEGIDVPPFCSFNDGENVAVHGATLLRPEATGHLLPALALPQVTLGHVVVEAVLSIVFRKFISTKMK